MARIATKVLAPLVAAGALAAAAARPGAFLGRHAKEVACAIGALVTTLGVEKDVNTFFRLVSPSVIARLREAFPDGAGGTFRVGITRAHKPVVPYSGLLDLVREYKGEDGSYCDGRVISFHRPTAAELFPEASVSGSAWRGPG